MKIDITEKAKVYINQKSISTITFEKRVCSRGWAGPMVEQVVSSTPPQAGEDFNQYDVEGIKVYIDKGFEFTKEHAEVDLRGFLFLKEIILTNIKIVES